MPSWCSAKLIKHRENFTFNLKEREEGERRQRGRKRKCFLLSAHAPRLSLTGTAVW
jgi:hypothetical protein